MAVDSELDVLQTIIAVLLTNKTAQLEMHERTALEECHTWLEQANPPPPEQSKASESPEDEENESNEGSEENDPDEI